MLATAGTLLALAGAWAEGVQVMREALRLNPSHPGYMHGLLALDRVLVGDDAAALAEASLIHAPDAYWGPFYRALALAGLGYLEQAHQEFAAAVLIEPTLLEDPQSVLGSYANFSESQMSVLVDRVALIRGSGEPPADPPSQADRRGARGCLPCVLRPDRPPLFGNDGSPRRRPVSGPYPPTAAKDCQEQLSATPRRCTSPWRPLARLNSPSVTEAGSAHARGWIDRQCVGLGCQRSLRVTDDRPGQPCRRRPC